MERYYQIVVTILAGVIGLAVGSFLNVVIYRVPNHMSVAFPASHCPKCKTPIKWYDNIPVLSWCILKGKCRACGEPISIRYTFVELANCLLWLGCMFLFWNTAPIYACLACVACSVSICVAFIDLENTIIPDRFQIILALLGLAAMWFDPQTKFWSHLIAAVAGFLLFWLVATIFSRILGTDAMGGGDVKLVTVIGLFLGWEKLLISLLVGTITASIVLLIVRARRGDEQNTAYPLGPFLAGGFIVALLLGPTIIRLYMTLH